MKQKIINWIRQQIKKTNTNGVVLGLSGGLDSALTVTLCCQALGKRRVLCLILPCETLKQDLADARLIAKNLGLKVKTVDLALAYKACLRILPEAGRVARGNVKARLRMLILYYFANKLNYLVCGTSNKSEILMGYFTKYGDGAEDIAPLGDLLKSQVRKLARTLNIPGRIINKTPSAGLWPNQTDEGELGISYHQLDDILLRLSRGQRQIQSARLVNRVKFRIKASEHKRQPPKICRI